MSRLNPGLLLLIAMIGFLHVGYSTLESSPPASGIKFARGVILTSDSNQNYYYNRQMKDNSFYDFVYAGDWYHEYYREIVSNAFGGIRTITVSSGFPPHGQPPNHSDEDVVFRAAYYSKTGARLTLYGLKLANADSKCFYALELQQLRCFGRERQRELPPL